MQVSLLVLFLLSSCTQTNPAPTENLLNQSWEDITQQARGQTVSLMMWQGSPSVNGYMENFVKPQLKQKYNITLEISGGQGSGIVSTLMNEMEAGQQQSVVDMMWINGATFFQLKQIGALYGPFLGKLPNAQYMDLDNPFINTDFQKPVDGMECPWGNLQFCMVYDSQKIPEPPGNLDELETYVKAHPGTFTITNDFTGMTLLKCFLTELSGSQDGLSGDFNEVKYERLSAELWQRINRMKPYFWKEGKTFPNEVSRLNQMYGAGELWLIYGNNDAMAENQVMDGLFPKSTRSYVLNMGTIRNTHYMGIAKNAAHKAGALVAINFLASPEAQLQKMKPEVWGDYTILDLEKLPDEERQKFTDLPQRKYALQREDLAGKALMEPAPEYMTRLYEDFRTEVIEK